MADRRRLLLALDRVGDALVLARVRARLEDLNRRIGLTKTGRIALVSAVVPWVFAYLVAGTALYIFSYAAVGVVLSAFLLVPRRLRLEADRTGLFPRVQMGDRLEVEITLRPGQARMPPTPTRWPAPAGAPTRWGRWLQWWATPSG